MTDETFVRAIHDAFLCKALVEGTSRGFSHEETFEKLVHVLLDIKDEVFQEKLLEAAMSKEPIFIDKSSS